VAEDSFSQFADFTRKMLGLVSSKRFFQEDAVALTFEIV
jgi:hypothetical protein